MAVTIEEVRMLYELVHRQKKKIKLGTVLYKLGRKEEGANPTRDIRELREERIYEFEYDGVANEFL